MRGSMELMLLSPR